MSYNDFVTRYYSEAWDVADKTVRTVIKNNGFKDPRVDYELVKSEGVTAGLDKTYTNYDVDRLREGGMKGFLGTVVRNCTLSALEKAINANKREKNLLVSGKREEKPRYSHLIDDVAQPRPTMTAHDTMEYPDYRCGRVSAEREVDGVGEGLRRPDGARVGAGHPDAGPTGVQRGAEVIPEQG